MSVTVISSKQNDSLQYLYEYCDKIGVSVNSAAISRGVLRYGATLENLVNKILNHAAEICKATGDEVTSMQQEINELDLMYPDLEKEIVLNKTENGRPERTYDNFFEIFERDSYYQGFRLNEISGRGEIHEIYRDTLQIRPFSDVEMNRSEHHIESTYRLRHNDTHPKALMEYLHDHSYNPIKEILQKVKWDGQERCSRFLTDICKAPDEKVYQEISKQIFFGGIRRLYEPGCKMDEMTVLIGSQGAGKSTLVRWLALEDRFFSECSTVDPKQGFEQINGKWIVEFAELDALRRSKTAEQTKAFITRQSDDQRLPWDKYASMLPRKCIFIGTSNDPNFISDLTGGRRYYPVPVKMTASELYAREKEIRDYILQAWAEALKKYQAGEATQQPSADVMAQIRELQAAAAEDDYRVGLISQYVEKADPGTFFCAKLLWDRVLCPDSFREQSKKDSREINQILRNIPGLTEATKTDPKYGKQRGFIKQ